MPVICASEICVKLRCTATRDSGPTHHDDECVPVEEPAIEVRDEADRKSSGGSRDVALVAEARAGEVVGDPTDARDCHQQVLQGDDQERSPKWSSVRDAPVRDVSMGRSSSDSRTRSTAVPSRRLGQDGVSASSRQRRGVTYPTTVKESVATRAHWGRGSSHT